MTFLVLVLLVLVARLAASRSGEFNQTPSARRGWIVATVLVTAALLPALLDAPLLAGPSSRLATDTASHLAIAQDIASSGIPHGWLPTYNGGFPIALHYPAVGWLTTAALLRLGVNPVVAVKGLGLVAVLAVPVLVFVTARVARTRATSAAAGAIAIAWITPYIQFTGGWEAFFVVGLLSQAIVVAVVVGWVAALAGRGRFDLAPIMAGLCAASHPQVFTVTSFVLFAAAAAAWRRDVFFRVVRSVAGGGFVAVALYGPGISSMVTPFGWPPNLSWKHVGFGPARVFEWLFEGDLLDYGHGTFVTAAWCAACVVHLLRLKRPLSRALLTASIVTMGLCVCGPAIATLGSAGSAVLSVFQPMRALALLPIVAIASIVVALDELSVECAAAARLLPTRAQRLVPALVPVALLAATAVELPPRVEQLHHIALELSRAHAPDSCVPAIEGFSGPLLQRWLARAPYGRSTFDGDRLLACAGNHGAELSRSGPMGSTFGAGAHVGLHAVAFSAIAPDAPGSAARAEALGIRTVVHTTSRRPGPPSDWEVIEHQEQLEMSRRIGGTDFVGVGCVRRVLRGRETEIMAELTELLRQRARQPTFLDDPHILTALDPSKTSLERITLDDDGCDAAQAVVREVPREPGAYQAEVETKTAVDVVFRATAFSGWHVRDGGKAIPTRRVAPGFFAVHVAPGRHALEAVVELPRGYVAGLLTATTFAVLLAALGGRLTWRDVVARWRTLQRARQR